MYCKPEPYSIDSNHSNFTFLTGLLASIASNQRDAHTHYCMISDHRVYLQFEFSSARRPDKATTASYLKSRDSVCIFMRTKVQLAVSLLHSITR